MSALRWTLPTTFMLLTGVYSSAVLPHSGHIHDEAFQACKAKFKGDKCSYIVDDAKRFTGSCQIFNAKSVCVRNKPIEYLEPVSDEIEIAVKISKAKSKNTDISNP